MLPSLSSTISTMRGEDALSVGVLERLAQILPAHESGSCYFDIVVVVPKFATPGICHRLVALVAALMSIQDHMQGWQKAIWMILIGLLLIVEMRSIKADRARADALALKDRDNQDGNFRQLRQQEDREFAATLGRRQDQFSATINGFDTSRRLENQHFGSLLHEQTRLFSGQHNTQDTLNALTGGDSYGVISPLLLSQSSEKAEYSLMISVRGKDTLWDVRVEMKEGSPIEVPFDVKGYLSGTLRRFINLGAVSTTYSQPTGWVVTPTADKGNIYFFWIWSRTKLTIEELDMRYNRTSNVWETSWSVRREGDPFPMEELKGGDQRVTMRPK